MPDVLPTLSRGMSVPVADIERELKRLWSQEGGGATRASLVNLAIYGGGEASLAANTELIAQLTEDHACRALLVAVEPEAATDRVQSWISAHCHVSRAGAKQVCCEQITFLLEGCLHASIPNIVFSHLDSDLPLYLWLRSELPSVIDEQLWTWVDRLIIDSATWKQPAVQMRKLQTSLAAAHSRLILRDLNWTRLSFFRQAFAVIFDDAVHRSELAEITAIEIDHAAGARTAALLFLGWFSGQLGWPCRRSDSGELSLDRAGASVAVSLREVEAEGISRCGVKSAAAQFRLGKLPDSNFLEAEVTCGQTPAVTTLFPGGAPGLLPLLNEELMRGGKDVIYRKSLAAILPLLD